MPDSFLIDFEPLGRRGKASVGETLLEAAQNAGIGLASVCAGVGTCQECRVRLISGKLTTPTSIEEDSLSNEDLESGFRLACQAKPLSDIKLDLPPESLTSVQRLQVEGEEIIIVPEPTTNKEDAYGLAVDIGTTKLAAYLVHLSTGKTVTQTGAMNPQIAYGEDVISRIAYTGRELFGAKILQNILVETINGMITDICAGANISPADVLDAVLVGNTAMHHLFAGFPVDQLGVAPFKPAITGPVTIPAKTLGLGLGIGAQVYLPPVIAGYVGADHLSMLLAIGLDPSLDKSAFPENQKFLNMEESSHPYKGKNIIALDIGTNTEISLVVDGAITCCSCASGPAFEGAHIHEGMRAAPGAIERARWSDGKVIWQTISSLPPVGICGSGILDVVASMLDGNLIKPNGAFRQNSDNDQNAGYILVSAAETGIGRNLMVTRKDIHEIQLAKAAIRAGIECLLANADLTFTDLDEIIVAGAFGTYLDLHSAIRIGLFPPLPISKFRQVGNAAGVGARLMLASIQKRNQAEQLANRISYLELAKNKDFMEYYIENLRYE
jgi:uncharacterized 2Fe-2S/4Fe-4S cluster protein (DUF4445 family)